MVRVLLVIALVLAALGVATAPSTVVAQSQDAGYAYTTQPWAIWTPAQFGWPSTVTIKKFAPETGRICVEADVTRCRSILDLRIWIRQNFIQ